MKSQIFAVLEIKLKYPFIQSADLLMQMATLWRCRIIHVSTHKALSVIMMPWKKFKMIFGRNPRVGDCEIPANTEDFIESIKIGGIRAE